MQPIDEKEALYLARICEYWEIINAQYGRTLATSADGFSFEAKLNELVQDENIKALIFYFGQHRREAKSKGGYIFTTEYYTEDDAPMLLPQRERRQVYGLGGLPAKQGMTPEHVQSMVSLEIAKMQALMQRQENERQYDYLSKMLETNKEMMMQRLDFDREKLEMERKAFEDNKEAVLAGAQTSIFTQLIDGLGKLAPVLAGFAGLAGIGEAPKQPQTETKSPEVEQKPKVSPVGFVSKPIQKAAEPDPLAGLTPQQRERLFKLAKDIEADPLLLDDFEDLAAAPLEEDEEVQHEP